MSPYERDINFHNEIDLDIDKLFWQDEELARVEDEFYKGLLTGLYSTSADASPLPLPILDLPMTIGRYQKPVYSSWA